MACDGLTNYSRITQQYGRCALVGHDVERTARKPQRRDHGIHAYFPPKECIGCRCLKLAKLLT